MCTTQELGCWGYFANDKPLTPRLGAFAQSSPRLGQDLFGARDLKVIDVDDQQNLKIWVKVAGGPVWNRNKSN